MYYKNQLVLTGALNDVGTPIAQNIGKSYRLGLEIDALFKLNKQLKIQPNIAISQNKNIAKFEKINDILQDLGNTDLSFSPNIIAGNRLTFSPNKSISFSFISKYVGKQFMSNIEEKTSKLAAYFTNDINMQYILKPKKIPKEITFTVLVNNIFNELYESNGYFYSYDDTWSNPSETTTIFGAGYYPQAGIHFLTGITLRF